MISCRFWQPEWIWNPASFPPSREYVLLLDVKTEPTLCNGGNLQVVMRKKGYDSIKSTMGFKIYTNLGCTIDCTEICITRERDREIQASTWSDNKRHNTVKFLVGIAPNGYITYISNVLGGQASDRNITN
jgi:hypothetical protein